MTELNEYLLSPVAQVALVIGIAEIIKKIGLDKKWIPVVDVVLGLISGILLYGISLGYGIANGVLLGLAIGLSACGMFSGIRNLTKQEVTNDTGD